MACNLCPELVASRKKIVVGELFGDALPTIVLIGEAPGVQEDLTGRPFMDISGDELRHALRVNGLPRFGIYITNVCLCHPPGNRDPKAQEIKNCVGAYLIPRLQEIQPEWVITVGKIASQAIAGPKLSIELEHGIPRPSCFQGLSFIHIPVYHPAAGLHDPSKMILFLGDMTTAGNVVKGKVSPYPLVDEFAEKENYKEIDNAALHWRT